MDFFIFVLSKEPLTFKMFNLKTTENLTSRTIFVNLRDREVLELSLGKKILREIDQSRNYYERKSDLARNKNDSFLLVLKCN